MKFYVALILVSSLGALMLILLKPSKGESEHGLLPSKPAIESRSEASAGSTTGTSERSKSTKSNRPVLKKEVGPQVSRDQIREKIAEAESLLREQELNRARTIASRSHKTVDEHFIAVSAPSEEQRDVAKATIAELVSLEGSAAVGDIELIKDAAERLERDYDPYGIGGEKILQLVVPRGQKVIAQGIFYSSATRSEGEHLIERIEAGEQVGSAKVSFSIYSQDPDVTTSRFNHFLTIEDDSSRAN